MWGLNICVRQEDKEGTDQRLGKNICTGQEDGRGGTDLADAGCMTIVWGDRELVLGIVGNFMVE